MMLPPNDSSPLMQASPRESRLRFVNGVGLYTLPALNKLSGFDHGFSARTGGVSEGCYASLDLSFSRPAPESRDNVLENYRRFARAAGFAYEAMVMDNYAHGTTVLPVTYADCGRGYLRAPLPKCDGLVSDDPRVVLVTGHADCMPFYCIDPVRRCIGLAHAGWRGALNRIGANVIDQMRKSYGSNPADVVVGVGPSICPACFEVGHNVAALFESAYPRLPCVLRLGYDKPHVDLWMVARRQFEEAGVPADQIHVASVCSYESDLLYSHRRDRGQTGGMAAYLRLTDAANLPAGID